VNEVFVCVSVDVVSVVDKDLEISRLTAYWPAPIHAVAHCQPILSSRDFRPG